jgi:hypothetical protein
MPPCTGRSSPRHYQGTSRLVPSGRAPQTTRSPAPTLLPGNRASASPSRAVTQQRERHHGPRVSRWALRRRGVRWAAAARPRRLGNPQEGACGMRGPRGQRKPQYFLQVTRRRTPGCPSSVQPRGARGRSRVRTAAGPRGLLELIIQEGNVALLRAVRCFDPDRSGCLRGLADSHVPRSLRRRAGRARGPRTRRRLGVVGGREPPRRARASSSNPSRARSSSSPRRLSGRDLSIFHRRWLGLHRCTLEEEGARLGITAERVRQIEDAITAQVRAFVLGAVPLPATA